MLKFYGKMDINQDEFNKIVKEIKEECLNKDEFTSSIVSFYHCDFDHVAFSNTTVNIDNVSFKCCNFKKCTFSDNYINIHAFYFDSCGISLCMFKNITIPNTACISFESCTISFNEINRCFLDYVFLNSSTFRHNKLVDSIMVVKDCSYNYISANIFKNVNWNNRINVSNNFIFENKHESCKNEPYIPMTCPDEGEFIGWKKCFVYSEGEYEGEYTKEYIVKLLIPADAKRSSAGGFRKCRCSKAIVLEIQDLAGNVCNDITPVSSYTIDFVYEVGKEVHSDYFDENRWHECSNGIHFFMNRTEAVRY